MENQIKQNEQNLSDSIIENMRTTAPWMKFLSVLSFIFGGP
jgi:hypothetical protein